MLFNPQTSKVFLLGRKLNTFDLFGVKYCGNFKSIHTFINYRIPRVITDDAMLPNCFNYCNIQMRRGHTDIKIPDFKPYRRRSTRKENAKNSLTEVPRKAFTYGIGAGSVIVSLYTTKSIVLFLVSFMGMSADVLAIAQIEIKLSEVPEGTNVTYKWRGKPLFVRHRTQFEIDQTRAVDIHTLRDPAKDEDRCPKPEWLVVIGVCTHLGCIPIANLGDFPGGYYCPCHGSHFDGAGRARKGPAPLNLEIPEHVFKDENTLVVG